MIEAKAKEPKSGLELEYELNEPLQKVWRAISIAEFRKQWLSNDALAASEATTVKPNEEISYRMRDDASPFLESTVTFRIFPNASGGTSLRIKHQLDDIRLTGLTMSAANNNSCNLLLAA
ncbi:MAG: SRPBCC family protein [Rhizobiaceae bacterium]